MKNSKLNSKIKISSKFYIHKSNQKESLSKIEFKNFIKIQRSKIKFKDENEIQSYYWLDLNKCIIILLYKCTVENRFGNQQEKEIELYFKHVIKSTS